MRYVNLPGSLIFEHHPFSDDTFRDHATQASKHGEDESREYPWRVVRWREGRGLDGSIVQESNARLATFEDGSQFLYIGDSTVYEVTSLSMRRGINDAFSLNKASLTHFAAMDQRANFRLVSEPTKLRVAVPNKKKARKVKMMGGVSAKEEQKMLQEEEKRLAQSRLVKQREKRQRQTSSAALDKGFLEEGTTMASTGRRRRLEDEQEDYEQDKRSRQDAVDEDRILRAKQTAKAKIVQDDGLELFDDSFIDDDDEAGGGGGGGGIIDSDSE